jgi:hypothetical protein
LLGEFPKKLKDQHWAEFVSPVLPFTGTPRPGKLQAEMGLIPRSHLLYDLAKGADEIPNLNSSH